MTPILIGEKNRAPVELMVAASETGGLGIQGESEFNIDEFRENIREIEKETP